MTRSIIRQVEWTCSPDTEPEGPPLLHEFECVTCEGSGPLSADIETARDWAFEHVGRHPSHTGYREKVHRRWRMERATG